MQQANKSVEAIAWYVLARMAVRRGLWLGRHDDQYVVATTFAEPGGELFRGSYHQTRTWLEQPEP